MAPAELVTFGHHDLEEYDRLKRCPRHKTWHSLPASDSRLGLENVAF